MPRGLSPRRALAALRLAAVCAARGRLGAGRLPAAAAADRPPLNGPPAADRLAGKFVRADRFTTDPAGVTTFSGGLFGGTGRTIARDGYSYLIFNYESRLHRAAAGAGLRRPGQFLQQNGQKLRSAIAGTE